MFFLLSTSLAVSPAADPRPFWSLFGSRDTDEDGVRDRHDACETLQESVNGYQDDDGCPDRLTSVTVAAWYLGQPVPEATLMVDVDERRHTDVGELTVTELNPSHTAALMATAGCLSSQAVLPLTESAQRVRLKLHPTGTRPVSVYVLDWDGRPVPESTVTWVSASRPGCGAATSVLLDDGSAQLKLGEGEHEVDVTVRGRRQTVQAVLEPGATQLVLQLKNKSGRTARGELLPDKVMFASGRHRLPRTAGPVLDGIATMLRSNPNTSMTVEGHADERGFDTYNIDLSRRRANAVIEALVSRGIARNRLTLEPLGENEPVSTGYSRGSLAENRRVQFRVIKPTATARYEPRPTQP